MTLLDDDLDSLLKAWTVPQSPDTLEQRLRRAYRDNPRALTTRERAARWIAGFAITAAKFAAVIASAVILLAVITRAFPQSLGLIAPPAAFTMNAEFLVYNDDGSSTVTEYRTSEYRMSSLLDEREIILSSSFPGNPLRTAAADVVNPLNSALDPMMQRLRRVITPLVFPRGGTQYMKYRSILAEALAARVRNRCQPSNMWGRPMTVLREETVLNYTTTVSQFTPEGRSVRFTEWLAPGLDCLSLRSTTEKTRADGSFRLESERRVVQVVPNPSRTIPKEPAQ